MEKLRTHNLNSPLYSTTLLNDIDEEIITEVGKITNYFSHHIKDENTEYIPMHLKEVKNGTN